MHAIITAAKNTGMPDDVFSNLIGTSATLEQKSEQTR